MERNGIPAVIIVSDGFVDNLKASADAFGMPEVQHVIVRSVYNNLSSQEAREQTLPVIPSLVMRLATQPLPPALASRLQETGSRFAKVPGREVEERTLEFRGPDSLSAMVEFNRELMARDWGDGFPLWPPTISRVQDLVAGVAGSADDLVCILPPGNGAATVELVAANAAMAGCTPEEMPVVMAALRAIAKADPVEMSVVLTSTSAHAAFVVVNGPVANALGINGGRCCIGPGKQNEVNLRIGRAILLCLKNIGRCYPGILDLDTTGTTRKFIAVIAENEEESPWDPYHVDEGYAAGESTVTMFWTGGELDISIQGHQSPEQLVRAIGSFNGGTYGLGYLSTMHGVEEDPDHPGKTKLPATFGRLLLLTPPHAHPIAESGYSKASLAKKLWELGFESVERLIEPFHKLHEGGKTRPEYEWLWELSEKERKERMMPVIEKPEYYSIVVAGSVRAKDLLMPTRVSQNTEVVTDTPAGTS